MPLDRAILAKGRTPLEYRRWLKRNEPENYKADWFGKLHNPRKNATTNGSILYDIHMDHALPADLMEDFQWSE